MVMMSPNQSLKEDFEQIAKRKEPESWTQWLGRNTAQQAARSSEFILGLPGAMQRGFDQTKSFVDSVMKPILPEGVSEAIEAQRKIPEKDTWHEFFAFPPTPAEVREKGTKKVSKAVFDDASYMEPRTEGEKALGEFNQDLTAMFMPGTGQLRMMTRIGAPIVGTATKRGLKYLGADEETADKAKAGVMLATTLATQSNPLQYSRDRIAEGKAMIPQGTTVDARPFGRSLFPLWQRLQRGLGVPSKSRAREGIIDLAEQVQNGRLDLHSLMDARDNVNEWIGEAGGWDVPPEVRDPTLRNLNELKRNIIDTVNDNLQTRFPEAAELYSTGYEAAAVTHQSNAISNFIERNFGRKAASVGAKLLFPTALGGATVLPKTAVAGTIAYPIYKAGQVLYRVGQSPTLANYYANVIEAAIRGNAPQMINNLIKLDNKMKLEEDKRKKNKQMSLEEFLQTFQE